jgi:pyruvate dehydrogenase E2 component (dihydrolipoamide acetyltransferase)
MVHEFTLPDVGEGLTEAEIVNWLVEPGDRVEVDQPVVEVETDKAIVEVPSPVDGTVAELLAEEGELVSVGTVIVTFDPDSDAASETEPTDGDADPVETAAPNERVFASPTTRRIARELGVDLGAVEGSGPGGRITEADVRTAAEAAGTDGDAGGADDAPTAATRRLDGTASSGDAADDNATSTDGAERDRTLAAPATRKLAAERGIDLDAVPTERTEDGEAFVTPAEVEAYAETRQSTHSSDAGVPPADGDDERIPYRGVRRTIGERMERSKYTAPHATHHDEVDVTALVETRSRLKAHAEERGSELSYLPFVIEAAVAGLREHPILNARLDEENEEIVLRGEYNVGIATATDAGLMVPVIEGADRKGLLELADELETLTERARDRSIAPEEMRGGTFSITNFGAVGGEYATPIINYPETAILGVGAIKDKPRVVEGEVVPRKVLTLSLSIDHRVIDGAEAARFINTVKEYLESPELLLLE